MATLVRIQAVWNGFQGAPGYTHWYGISDGDSAAAANALAPRMRAFFDAIKLYLPNGADVKVQRAYQVINDVTGNITSEGVLASDPALVTSTAGASTAYAGPTGACVNWETGTFNANGRRIRGRTYLVPLNQAFEPDGSLNATALGAITAAATAALGGTGSLGVWTRPVDGGGGSFSIAIAALVKDKAAVLKSRRD